MDFLASIGATAGLLILAVSAYHHLHNRRMLEDALSAHGVPSQTLRTGLSIVIAAIESALAILGIVAVAFVEPIIGTTFAAITGMYVLYALYATWLLKAHPQSPCGCSAHQYPVNLWVPLRAAGLSCGTAVAAAASNHVYTATDHFQNLVAAIAGVACGAILWALPEAMAQPAAAQVEAA